MNKTNLEKYSLECLLSPAVLVNKIGLDPRIVSHPNFEKFTSLYEFIMANPESVSLKAKENLNVSVTSFGEKAEHNPANNICFEKEKVVKVSYDNRSDSLEGKREMNYKVITIGKNDTLIYDTINTTLIDSNHPFKRITAYRKIFDKHGVLDSPRELYIQDEAFRELSIKEANYDTLLAISEKHSQKLNKSLEELTDCSEIKDRSFEITRHPERVEIASFSEILTVDGIRKVITNEVPLYNIGAVLGENNLYGMRPEYIISMFDPSRLYLPYYEKEERDSVILSVPIKFEELSPETLRSLVHQPGAYRPPVTTGEMEKRVEKSLVFRNQNK